MNIVKKSFPVSFLVIFLLQSCGENTQSQSALFPRSVKVNVVSQGQALGSDPKTFDLSSVTLNKDRFDICKKTSSDIATKRTTYVADKDYCSSYIIKKWDGNRFQGIAADIDENNTLVAAQNAAWIEICAVYDKKIECRSVFDEAPAEAIDNPDEHQDYITDRNTFTMR